MKKVVSLALSLVLVLSMSVTAFAYEGSSNNQAPYSGSGQTTISTKIYGSCIVTIPETVEVTAEQTWSIDLTDVNIDDTDAIKIRVINADANGYIKLSNEKETRTIDCELVRGDNKALINKYGEAVLAYVKGADLAGNTFSTTFSGKIVSDTQGYKAGTYSGVMQYAVEIAEYSENFES